MARVHAAPKRMASRLLELLMEDSAEAEASTAEPQNGILVSPALGLDHLPRQKPNHSDKHC